MNSLFSGDTPAAPLAISSTVSLVDMQPSVSSRSKVIAVADRSAASSSADVSTASVVSTHSMVASPGASIPAPLAIPPMVQAAEGAWAEGAWAEGAWAEGAWAEGAWAEGAWAEGAWAEGAWAEGAWAEGAWAEGAWAEGAWAEGAWGERFPPRSGGGGGGAPPRGNRAPEGDLHHGVGGPDRVGGGQPTRPGGFGDGGVHAGQELVYRQPLADQAGRADRDLPGPDFTERGGQVLGGGVRVLEAERPGAGVGPAGVEHHGPDPAALDHLAGPGHRGGLHPVSGEHGGGGPRGPVVQDHGHVRLAGLLQPGRHSGGPETKRGGHAQGDTPCVVRPAVSGRPSMRLAIWMAWPAAPLTRLSRAQTTTARPACGSAAACRWAALEPRVAPVTGHRPSGSTCTKGSPP